MNQQGQRIADGHRTRGAAAGDAKASSHFHLTLWRIDREHNWWAGVYSGWTREENEN